MEAKQITVTETGSFLWSESGQYQILEFPNGLILHPVPSGNPEEPHYYLFENREDLNNPEVDKVSFSEPEDTITFTPNMFSEIFQSVVRNNMQEEIPDKFYDYWTP